MYTASEYVSPGHPDSTADCITSHLLDVYREHDPKVRYAVEVLIKDHTVFLAGEVTSTWHPSNDEIGDIVREAIRMVGYTLDYSLKWPNDTTLNAEKVVVISHIGKQSPDIAQGVDREGWGDQGCIMGMATKQGEFGYLPQDVYLSHAIGNNLYAAALYGDIPIGLDIKVLVSLADSEVRDGVKNIQQIVVAAPMLPENEEKAKNAIKELVITLATASGAEIGEIIINGTGAYVVHSSIGDAGVVGRKLAVNFYGLNCPIGGGSPFGKDLTKADVTLNLYARYLSLRTMFETCLEHERVFTKITCCIGQRKILVSQFDESNAIIDEWEEEYPISEIVHELGLDRKRDDLFFTMARAGLFSVVDKRATLQETLDL